MQQPVAPVPEVPDGAAPDGARPGYPPLAISGVVVSKAQLLEALKLYVPGITDFAPLPDGQHFSILFKQPDSQ